MGLDMYLIKRQKGTSIEDMDLWDFEKELIYWRKANQVHNYFCTYGEEIEEQVVYKISKDVLLGLLDKCYQVINKVVITQGKVVNGQKLTEHGWENEYEDGIVIVNTDEIAEILPRCKGFFFGSNEYNGYYLDDIKYTIESINNIINNIDFENEDLYYLASW